MKKYILIAVLMAIPSSAKADVKDAMQAVCRVIVTFEDVEKAEKPGQPDKKTMKYVTGTGVVYLEGEDKYWIMTAGHVVSKDNLEKIQVEFFVDGFQSRRIKATQGLLNYTKGQSNDLAILIVDKKEIGPLLKPKVVPIAPKSRRQKLHQTILSTGCPNGTWPTTFLGHIRSINRLTFTFIPSPHKGRSGSPIFNEEATEIIGIIIWQNKSLYGTAISVEGIYNYSKTHK